MVVRGFYLVMKALIKKIKKHIAAEFFAGLVGFIACAPFSGFGIGIVGAAGLAMIAFFMLNSKQG